MKKYRFSFLILSLFILASCSFDDGKPWAVASFNLTGSYDNKSDLYETASSYEIKIEKISLKVSEMSLVAGSDNAISFDPANPPEGYSNCHNDHCHADDGTLPTYAEIELAISGASSGGGALISQTVDSAALLTAKSQQLKLGECSSSCILEKSKIKNLDLAIQSIEFDVVVEDKGALKRLGNEKFRLSHKITFDNLKMSKNMDLEIGRMSASAYLFSVDLILSLSFLDIIDFKALKDGKDKELYFKDMNIQIVNQIKEKTKFNLNFKEL